MSVRATVRADLQLEDRGVGGDAVEHALELALVEGDRLRLAVMSVDDAGDLLGGAELAGGARAGGRRARAR